MLESLPDLLRDSPFTPIVAACLAVGLVLALLARGSARSWPAGIAAPAVFLVGYYLTYNKIPDFPPVGSTNKLFYVALIAGAIGLLLDLLPRAANSSARAAFALLAAPLIAVWIGLPRLTEPTSDTLATIAALALGGAWVVWRLADLGAASPRDGWMLLAVLPAAYAPVALFGGSSTSVGLCLGLAAGLGIVALVNLIATRRLGYIAALGAGGGLLGMIDTVTLITRKSDPIALALLLAVPLLGEGASRVLRNVGPRTRAVLVALCASVPVAAIVALLMQRHNSPV